MDDDKTIDNILTFMNRVQATGIQENEAFNGAIAWLKSKHSKSLQIPPPEKETTK